VLYATWDNEKQIFLFFTGLTTFSGVAFNNFKNNKCIKIHSLYTLKGLG
jgi:hypothetical protein